jgi:hypothetical protein
MSEENKITQLTSLRDKFKIIKKLSLMEENRRSQHF